MHSPSLSFLRYNDTGIGVTILCDGYSSTFTIASCSIQYGASASLVLYKTFFTTLVRSVTDLSSVQMGQDTIISEFSPLDGPGWGKYSYLASMDGFIVLSMGMTRCSMGGSIIKSEFVYNALGPSPSAVLIYANYLGGFYNLSLNEALSDLWVSEYSLTSSLCYCDPPTSLNPSNCLSPCARSNTTCLGESPLFEPPAYPGN